MNESLLQVHTHILALPQLVRGILTAKLLICRLTSKQNHCLLCFPLHEHIREKDELLLELILQIEYLEKFKSS